jgi:hypothetical protein
MRTLFGIVLGALLSVGAAWLHDTNATVDPINPRLTDQQIVNWEVLSAVLRQTTDGLGNLFHNATGK